ncbi:isochorismatase family protein [Ferrimicrobium sp.]|uniref:isochorismatase family protein n=1 Tax=Ferrimicrobium sp. TaxID=2926050 RepID=UPI00260AC32D|nr:isochorismatase family protein [Ferrimicrobium sp.]
MGDPSVDADYRKAGFSGSVGFGERPAVLVVDLVRAYLDPRSSLYSVRYEGVLEATSTLVATAREWRHPVVFTGVSYRQGGVDGGYFWQKVPALRVFEEGSELRDFDERLMPAPTDLVIMKQYASAFFGTSLASALHHQGVDTLLIAGVSTSGCVRASALDTLQSGFRPIIVREAVGDRTEEIHRANLFDLEAKYADLSSLSAACTYLAQMTTVPEGH